MQGNDYINQNATLTSPPAWPTTARSCCSRKPTTTTTRWPWQRHLHQRRRRHHPGQRGHRRRSRPSAAQIINAGTINFDTNTTLGSRGANLINTGLISIAGATVTVVGSSFTNDPGGLISGYGTFNTSGVTLTNNGIIDLSPPSILGVDLEPSTVAITYYDAGGDERGDGHQPGQLHAPGQRRRRHLRQRQRRQRVRR